ncbi:MAG: peptidase M1 [Bacteroidetes bacterium HGW-Bacteroidetes-13]|nr:MAG: peptidase M1 [Bacteroidetes bacterium HGW-Bacteroidetes-13]
MNKLHQIVFFLFIILSVQTSNAQSADGYWQQHVNYTMDVDMNVKNYQYTGSQTLVYTNNSPDTLHQVFYHLYFNAFQPGSEMDVRSRTIRDADSRVADRISKLQPDEIGFLKVTNLKQDGKKVDAQTVGTILQVPLAKPILPGASTTFTLDFNGQVPVQIRRSGRNNAEGVALSMTQWFPKLAEYDFEGWHPDPYIAREFHGVWGDFDVTINIDKTYTLGASGYLQNPNEIGHGYQDAGVTPKKIKGDKLKWHFIAPQVHDFAWAADPNYVHDTYPGPNGVTLHFLYKNKPEILENWKKLQPDTAAFMNFFNEHVGNYPYKQYSVIQGGDGGMEYAMLTLITGERKYESLAGVTAHELAHSWFQHVLASNESKNEWMDEGFTTYISTEAENVVLKENKSNPHQGSYRGYVRLATSGLEKPQTTHADRYETNFAYGIAAYSKGAIFLEQLGYVIGKENLAKTIKRYYNDFKFKHPTPNDIMRVAEKVSGIQLDWYLTDWTKTTNTIDYAVKEVNHSEGKTTVALSRIGLMPMPLDLQVTFDDGSIANYYIPLRMMFGQKPAEGLQRTVLPDWAWAYPEYAFDIESDKTVQKVVIDASERMADINRDNNVFESKGN